MFSVGSRSVSIGDICDSTFYLSIERRSAYNIWAMPHFGKTYNGTIAGIVWQLGRFVLLGHIRSDKALHT